MLQSIVIGNLGSDAEIKGAQGAEFTTFRIAHTDRYKDAQGNQHEQTTWVDVTLNGKPAVFDYLKRGTLVAVIGHVSLRVYSSPKDRCMKAGIQIAARSIELIGGKVEPIPSRLYDGDGIQHEVTKWYHTDVVSATLYTQRGEMFMTDANGWVYPAQPQQTANTTPQTASNDQTNAESTKDDGAQIF